MAADICAPGREICEALGLDQYRVRALELTFRVGEVPVVKVEMFAEVEPGTWDTVLATYELHPVTEETS